MTMDETQTPPAVHDSRKALTLHQPWAWLLVYGHKNVENRRWPTRFRGRLYIHAGAKFDEAGYEWVKETFTHIQMPAREEFRYGGIVGSVWVHGCTNADEDTENSAWAMGGQYHWHCKDAEVLPFEPMRGAQQIWTVGNQKRVMELPEGFTIKTKQETIGLGVFVTAYLYRDGVQVDFAREPALKGKRAEVNARAMRRAHELNALLSPPSNLCECEDPHPCTQ